ncbi:MAG: ion transporter [Nitriliruptoraceae bacterium]|nr:ion transporter [Nitriliruptoraceae bacterium]
MDEQDATLRTLPHDERERLADQIADRLDAPMSALGIAFLLLVLAETIVEPDGTLGTTFQIATWLIVALFAAEFALRFTVAPSRRRFLRRNWWQLIFLVLPFLRIFRALRAVRVLRLFRASRILSSALRATRTAGRRLRGRVAWLGAVTLITILAASQLLFELGDVESYADALYRAAMVTITGQTTGLAGIGRILDVVLGSFSVVVFATLAGIVGAYLVEQRADEGSTVAT